MLRYLITFFALWFVMALVALINPATAQSSGWQLLETEIAPPARHDHVLVATDEFGKLVLFGGRGDSILGDTWIYDIAANEWRNVVTDSAPEARFGMAATYDAARKRVLLFAGQQSSFFNDVWAFDVEAETWSKLETTGTPPVARYGTSAVIDPVADTLIISHGFASGRFDDTFALDLNTNEWRDISPETRPLRRCLHESIFDPVSNKMILFGGCSSGSGPCPQGDLWSFDPAAGTWTEIKPEGEIPSARSNPSLVADTDGKTWLFGGRDDAGAFNGELWLLDPATGRWEKSEEHNAPPGRSSHDAAWESVSQQMFVFGGKGQDGDMNDLWSYKPQ